MNYSESTAVLDEIKKANKILLNCHRGPDPDGIGSALSMKIILESMGKKAEIICPSKVISKQTDFLKGYDQIKLGVDFDKFDFSAYDLFISVDTPNLPLMTGNNDSKIPNIKTIVIDHHHVSPLTGFLMIKDEKATSVGEMLYSIFADWGVALSEDLAGCILTSIIGDTGAFSYPNTTARTMRIVAELMDMGVDKDMIVNRIYRDENFDMLKFWYEVLGRMQIDKDNHFVYAMIPYSVYKKYSKLDDAKAKAASLFAPIVAGTDFGFIGVEESPEFVTISFRGRTDFDTSIIAKELGGGGHKVASAVKIEKVPFAEVEKQVLEVARKYARKD